MTTQLLWKTNYIKKMVTNLQFKPKNKENDHLYTFISVLNATLFTITPLLTNKIKN
jgi:hypothetical protein